MSFFFRSQPEENIEMAETSERQVEDEQPGPSERPSSPTPPPPEYHFAVQITHNLISRVSITDCRPTKDRLKAPLRNNNDDILFWEENQPDESFAPDIMERGPEESIENFEAGFFARILNRLLVNDHPMAVPRKNVVITYPGPYHATRETDILREVRALQLFEGTVFCFPESTVYHELYYSGRSADDCQGEIPIIVYGGIESAWIHAVSRDVIYRGEDQGLTICSGHALVMAGMDFYNRILAEPEIGPSQRGLIFPFESLIMDHFDLMGVEQINQVVHVDRKKTAEMASFMRPDTCFVSGKAYITLRENIIKVIKSIFGTEEKRKLRVICVGKMFTHHFHRFKFYTEIGNLTVKWQNNESKSLEKILCANTCLAALHDGIDLLKLDVDELVTRPIYRTDLSIELSAPVPRDTPVEY